MLATRCLAWRLEKAGIPTVYKSYDAANAFACGDRQQIDEITMERLLRQDNRPRWQEIDDANLLRARRSRFEVAIACPEGWLTMRPATGGFMGDCCEGEIFTEKYGQAVAQWTRRLYNQGPVRAMVAHAFNGQLGPANGFSGSYLDDIIVTLPLLQEDTLAAMVRKDAEVDAELNKALADRSYAQNTGKQCIVPAFRSRILTKSFARQARARGLAVGPSLKHLGAHFVGGMASEQRELQERLRAGTAGWQHLREFWSSPAPRRIKRSMFIALVAAAFLSAAEVLAFTNAQIQQLCTAQVRKLRALLLGQAAQKKDDKWRAATNVQVYRFWRLLPAGLALTVRRLTWFQAILKNMPNNTHLLTCIFGTLRCETAWREKTGQAAPPPLDQEGKAHSGANPWVRRLAEDLETLMLLEVAADFARLWTNRSFEALLFNDELREAFLAIDVLAIRSAFLAYEWLPPGAAAQLSNSVAAESLDLEVAGLVFFPCGFCEKTFDNRRQLANHIAKQHDKQSLLSLIQPSNQCINCRTTFRNRTEAIAHLYRAHYSGRCIKDNAKHAYDFIQPPSFQCPICLVKPQGKHKQPTQATTNHNQPTNQPTNQTHNNKSSSSSDNIMLSHLATTNHNQPTNQAHNNQSSSSNDNIMLSHLVEHNN